MIYNRKIKRFQFGDILDSVSSTYNTISDNMSNAYGKVVDYTSNDLSDPVRPYDTS